MNLNNALPIPPGLRLCYWHPHYEPPFFVNASKDILEEQRALKHEKQLELMQLEEAILANRENYICESDEAAYRSAVQGEEDEPYIFDRDAQNRLIHAHNFERAFLAFDAMLQENNSKKESLDFYNIQTIGGRPPLRIATARELRAIFISR